MTSETHADKQKDEDVIYSKLNRMRLEITGLLEGIEDTTIEEYGEKKAQVESLREEIEELMNELEVEHFLANGPGRNHEMVY